MSTKWKIVSGFVVMILLLGLVAFIGYNGLSGVFESFKEYQRLAHINVNFSDLRANLQASTSAIRLFRINVDPAQAEESRKYIKANQDLAAKTKSLGKSKITLDTLDESEKHAAVQLRTIAAVEHGLQQAMDQYDKVQQPAARVFGTELVNLTRLLITNNNTKAAEQCAVMLNDFAAARSAFSRFAFARTKANGARALEALNTVGKDMDAFTDTLQSNSEREYNTKLQKALEDMVKATKSMNGGVEELELQLNNSALELMLATTVAGLIIGCLLAGFIILGLIQVLHKVGNFAEAIAEGDFNA